MRGVKINYNTNMKKYCKILANTKEMESYEDKKLSNSLGDRILILDFNRPLSLKKTERGCLNYFNPNSLINSKVEYTFTLDCCLNAFSSDHIGQFNAKARAKYGLSLGLSLPCGDILLASGKNTLYVSSENDSTFISSNEKIKENARLSILPNFFILSLLFDNSSKTYFGEINAHPKLDNFSITLLLSEFVLKKENSMEASTINILGNFAGISVYNPCLFATLSLSSEPHFRANSSVILLSFNNSSATLNINLSDIFSLNALDTIKFISSLLSSLNPSSNSSGTSIFNSVILSSQEEDKINYLILSHDVCKSGIGLDYSNLGIGTATPSATLSVAGNLSIGGLSLAGNGTASNNITSLDCITFRNRRGKRLNLNSEEFQTGGKICAG